MFYNSTYQYTTRVTYTGLNNTQYIKIQLRRACTLTTAIIHHISASNPFARNARLVVSLSWL